MEGLSQLLKIVDKIGTKLGHRPTRRVLLTMYDSRTNLSKQVAEKVRGFFKDDIFQTVIPRNVKLAEAPSFGKPIEYMKSASPLNVEKVKLTLPLKLEYRKSAVPLKLECPK